ncbi:hypothetical protein TNCV_980121 [Trichonephila clavipes]|uniref:Uncharacterized protein n=1 Tax=Trichonephila clavipes TaxID=2585209 RepID=A0A8X6V382_TRICX|nr:hypothetical protein TNCV_980121 [Trichonephila clavipes]
MKVATLRNRKICRRTIVHEQQWSCVMTGTPCNNSGRTNGRKTRYFGPVGRWGSICILSDSSDHTPRLADCLPKGYCYRDFSRLIIVCDHLFLFVVPMLPAITPLNLEVKFGKTLYIMEYKPLASSLTVIL